MMCTPYIKIKLQTCFQALDLEKKATIYEKVEGFFGTLAIKCIWEAADEFLMLLKFPVLQHLIFLKTPGHEVLAGIIGNISGKLTVSSLQNLKEWNITNIMSFWRTGKLYKASVICTTASLKSSAGSSSCSKWVSCSVTKMLQIK